MLNEVLCISTEYGYNNIAQILVNSGKVDINEMNEYCSNPLLLASGSINNKKLAKVLLNSGERIDVRDKDGNTPLIISISKFRVKWVKMLLKYNANCYCTNSAGCTALDIAEALGDLFPYNNRQKILGLIQEKILLTEET